MLRKKKILIDTKYGQNINLSFKEVSKRIYRFKNFKSLKQSFKYIAFNNNERIYEQYWDINKIEKNFNSMNEDLNNCEIRSFYLHSPPRGILNNKYLEVFTSYFNKKKNFTRNFRTK